MQSREELATRLLTLTKLSELKERARHDREWARVYHGFRTDHLTREGFLRGASAFARQLPLLESLCHAFLDGLGVQKDPKLAPRLAGVTTTPAGAGEDASALLKDLASTDLSALPVHPPAADAAGEAAVQPPA